MISIVVISKDERALGQTLTDLSRQKPPPGQEVEIIVVDASAGRLDDIRRAHPDLRWEDYQRSGEKRITIPEQRNTGVGLAKGDVIVFTDAGCRPADGWLALLVAPLHEGEQCVAGSFDGAGKATDIYSSNETAERSYVREAPTLNLAISAQTLHDLGGFDEAFDYGSDVDLCWRVVDAGFKILKEPAARVTHDFEGGRKQRKRSFRYGAARARLYSKHRHRLRELPGNDPVLLFYPLFILGLPLTFVFPFYPLLLALPAWRGRRSHPVATVVDHLVYGAGALAFLTQRIMELRGRRA